MFKANFKSLAKPTNRKAEVLAFFILEPKISYSYLYISYELNQNNTHRYIQWLTDEGVWFIETTVKFRNRFGREASYKRFKVYSKKNAREIYKKINKSKK